MLPWPRWYRLCALVVFAVFLIAPDASGSESPISNPSVASDGLLYSAVTAADEFWAEHGVVLPPAKIYTYDEAGLGRSTVEARGEMPGRSIYFERHWLANIRSELRVWGSVVIIKRSLLQEVCQVAVHERGHNAGFPHSRRGIMRPDGDPDHIVGRCIRFSIDNAPSVRKLTYRTSSIRYARRMKSSRPTQPKVRSSIGLAAHQATGAGKHGGSKRQRRRADRQNTKRALRAGSEVHE